MASETLDQQVLKEALQADLEAHGMTPTAAGRIAGVDTGNLGRWLRDAGKRTLSIADAASLIRVFGAKGHLARAYPEAAESARRAQIEAASSGDQIIQMLHSDLQPNPENYRKTFQDLELFAEELAQDGILAPLSIRFIEDQATIFAGERRWRAVGIAIEKGLWPDDRPLPCLVRDIDEAEALRLSIVENLQRNQVPRDEEAEAFRKLRDLFGMSTQEICKALGVKKRYVEQSLNLINKLAPKALTAFKAGNINFAQARELWTFPPLLQSKVLPHLASHETVNEAAAHALRGCPWKANAFFDFKEYEGECVTLGPNTYVLDIDQFETLQLVAIERFLKQAEKDYGAIMETDYFEPDYRWERTTERDGATLLYGLLRKEGTNRPCTEIKVHGAFVKKELPKVAPAHSGSAQGVEEDPQSNDTAQSPTPPETEPRERASLSYEHRFDAHNLKTLALQKAICPQSPDEYDVGFAIALATLSMFGDLAMAQPPLAESSLIRVTDTYAPRLQFFGTPTHKKLHRLLTPLIEQDLLRVDSEGRYEPQRAVEALLEAFVRHPKLNELFLCCVAAAIGSWPGSIPKLGNSEEVLAINEVTDVDLAGIWQMNAHYLSHHDRHGLERVAATCGKGGNPLPFCDMPPDQEEARQWLLDHPDRDPNWLPPELKFLSEADAEREVDQWLNGPQEAV